VGDQNQFSWKNFIFGGVVLALIQLGVGFYLNQRLEGYKDRLTENTETLKSLLQANAPFAEQRRAAYVSILQNARQLTDTVGRYYYLAKGPADATQRLERRLNQLDEEMLPSGSRGGDIPPSKGEALSAVNGFFKARNQNADACSDAVLQQVDAFLNTVIDDLESSAREHETAESDTTARRRLLDAFNTLNKAVNEALGFPNVVYK
jgi:prefoldin subunit 5